MNPLHTALLIAVMSAVTILLRALPFLVFRKNVPQYVLDLGSSLPPAIIGMLVIYCLKDINLLQGTHGIPEAIGIAVTILSHVLKRNTLLSILSGTIVYMILIRIFH